MTTFTATASPSGAFVTLALSDVSQDSLVTITREPSPGSIVVRGTPVEIAAAGATVLTDLEFPFGTPITYTAVLRDPSTGVEAETLTASVTAIPLGQDGMVVSDPISNRQVTVDVHDQRDESSAFRGFRYDLAGRSTPLYLLEEHGGWTWTLDLRTEDKAERVTLDDLLRSKSPVLLRVASGCDLREGWVVPEQISVARFSNPASDSRRVWSVTVGEIAAPDSLVEGVAVTLTDLHEYEPTTLQDLADRPPATLLELSLAVIDSVG